MVKLQFNAKYPQQGIAIPNLKGLAGINLPLRDFATGKSLPPSKQIIDVSENEAQDLMRQWPGVLVKKQTKRKESEE